MPGSPSYLTAVMNMVLLLVQLVPLHLHRVARNGADHRALLTADQRAGHGTDDRAADAAVFFRQCRRSREKQRAAEHDCLYFLSNHMASLPGKTASAMPVVIPLE